MKKGKCVICNKEFMYHESQVSGKYCSIKCASKSPNKGRPKGRKDSSPDAYKNRSLSHIGLKHSEETKRKQSIGISKTQKRLGLNKGKLNPNYIDGRKHKYNIWRKSVYERDNYICQDCGQVSGYLNAHHIKSQKNHPELRYDINNGITLCYGCHQKRHKNGFQNGTLEDEDE